MSITWFILILGSSLGFIWCNYREEQTKLQNKRYRKAKTRSRHKFA